MGISSTFGRREPWTTITNNDYGNNDNGKITLMLVKIDNNENTNSATAISDNYDNGSNNDYDEDDMI